jgi:alkaline phosphatase D
VWDDHDYGINNGDKTFMRKRKYRKMYLDFIGEPLGTPRRKENNTGIFQDYVLTTQDGLKVHFILLDVRFDFNSS